MFNKALLQSVVLSTVLLFCFVPLFGEDQIVVVSAGNQKLKLNFAPELIRIPVEGQWRDLQKRILEIDVIRGNAPVPLDQNQRKAMRIEGKNNVVDFTVRPQAIGHTYYANLKIEVFRQQYIKVKRRFMWVKQERVVKTKRLFVVVDMYKTPKLVVSRGTKAWLEMPNVRLDKIGSPKDSKIAKLSLASGKIEIEALKPGHTSCQLKYRIGKHELSRTLEITVPRKLIELKCRAKIKKTAKLNPKILKKKLFFPKWTLAVGDIEQSASGELELAHDCAKLFVKDDWLEVEGRNVGESTQLFHVRGSRDPSQIFQVQILVNLIVKK